MKQILKSLLNRNFLIIFFLGISSGLPLSLILSTLKAMLVDLGVNITNIGLFSLIALPYNLKIIPAPIIDSKGVWILTKLFGHRKSWLILMQSLLAIAILALGIISPTGNLYLIFIITLIIASLSATQDIVIDAYRIELLSANNQGVATGVYIYGYRIGMLISGALGLIIAEKYGWIFVFPAMSITMILLIFITIIATDTRKNWVEKKYNFKNWIKEKVVKPFAEFLQRELAIKIIFFIILFKLADAFAGNLTMPFLMDIGFTKTELAKILKTFGLIALLIGVFCGGMIVKFMNIRNSLWIAIILQMLSNLAFCYLSKIGYDEGALYRVVFIEYFCGGVGDAIFVAFLSQLCNKEFSATQYALFSSLSSLSRSLLASVAGVFATKLGWYNFFIFSALLALPSIYLMTKIFYHKKLKIVLS